MSQKPGAASPNDFVTTLAEFVTARTKEQSAAGSRRAIMARFEKQGCHMPGVKLFLKLRDMEPADAELMLSSALRYCRWAQLGIGEQATLFPASDDAGQPARKAADGLTEAVAYEEGFLAGKAGRDASDQRYQAGTPMYAKFHEGWIDGQSTLAAELGQDRPEDGSTLRRKAKKGAEVRQAKPKGRGRGAGKRDTLSAGREHLGG